LPSHWPRKARCCRCAAVPNPISCGPRRRFDSLRSGKACRSLRLCASRGYRATVKARLKPMVGIVSGDHCPIVHNDLLTSQRPAIQPIFDSSPCRHLRFPEGGLSSPPEGACAAISSSGAHSPPRSVWDAKVYGVYAANNQSDSASWSAPPRHEWALEYSSEHGVPLSMSPALKDWMAADPVGTKAFLDPVPPATDRRPGTGYRRAASFLCGPDSRYVTGKSPSRWTAARQISDSRADKNQFTRNLFCGLMPGN